MIDSDDVGRVGHRDDQFALFLFDRTQNVVVAELLRKQCRQHRVDEAFLEIDVRDVELFGKGDRQLFVRENAVLDQVGTETGLVFFRLVERILHLLGGAVFGIDDDVTEALAGALLAASRRCGRLLLVGQLFELLFEGIPEHFGRFERERRVIGAERLENLGRFRGRQHADQQFLSVEFDRNRLVFDHLFEREQLQHFGRNLHRIEVDERDVENRGLDLGQYPGRHLLPGGDGKNQFVGVGLLFPKGIPFLVRNGFSLAKQNAELLKHERVGRKSGKTSLEQHVIHCRLVLDLPAWLRECARPSRRRPVAGRSSVPASDAVSL
ncbi:MAG: hypothetical protein BWY66_00668 [bacterium ADurb.Bin374]|nr:MAG: hypothetical protein BWY66_00668 [bacterium ADurb.Bin374]